MEARSHNLMDLDACPILSSPFDQVGDICRALGKIVGGRKPIDIRANASETGLDVDISMSREMGARAFMDLADIAEKFDLARVTMRGEIIIERRAPVRTLGRARVVLPPGAFLQATKKGESILADMVGDIVGDSAKIADLFCGIGTFALQLASQARIFAVDGNKSAISALQTAVNNTQGLKPVTALARDLFRNPVLAADLKKFDAVVLDPPRAGAEAQVRQIASSGVKIVVAISCDPGTFARDAAILMQNGYILDKITPIDQFKYTSHVELIARFRRG